VRTGFPISILDVADAAPALAGLAALDAPISGELRADFDPAQPPCAMRSPI